MGSGLWGWILPVGLWEIARPLLPSARVRPQGGGVANIDDEAVFAAIVYVLVSGCTPGGRRLSDSVGRCDGSPEMTFECGGHCSLSGLFPGREGEIMSMRPLPAPAVPESTARVARAAFPRGCLAMRIRDEFGAVFESERFVAAFAYRGGPSMSPGMLALVSVLHYAEADRPAGR